MRKAIRRFRKTGIAGVSLRETARAVGITPMAVYHYFDGKEALIDAIVAAGFGVWDTYLVKAAAEPTPLARLRACLIAYRQFALDEPRFFELMMLTARPGIPEAPESLKHAPSAAYNTIMASLVELAPERDRAQVTELMLALWATAHGLLALHFTGRFGGADARFVATYDAVIERVLSALLQPGEQQ